MRWAKLIITMLILLLLVLQYKLWFGKGGYRELQQLRIEIENQQVELIQLKVRNQALQAEVQDLKLGLQAIEERAREELGMIKKGEVFYQLVPPAQDQAND